MSVIPNGVDPRKISVESREYRLHTAINLPPDTPLIGCVGRLSPEKRVEDVIRALALLESIAAHLVLIGDGPEKTHLTRIAKSLGLVDKVHFLGERDDLDIILHDLSVFVLASSFEGMSNSLLEAMAAGCPVAVSAIDTNLELIGKNTRGWSFSCGEIRELAEVITTIVMSPEQKISRVGAARVHMKRYYSEKTMLQNWQALLEKAPCVST